MINYVVLLQNTEKEIIYSPDLYHETPPSLTVFLPIHKTTLVDMSYTGSYMMVTGILHDCKTISMLNSVLRNINPHSIVSFEQNNKNTVR